jgi:predicted ATPase
VYKGLILYKGPVDDCNWLLVFDEVQLLDVSSATLLADRLSWSRRMGGVIVGTSNKVPDDLYENGVQRERLEEAQGCLDHALRTTHS